MLVYQSVLSEKNGSDQPLPLCRLIALEEAENMIRKESIQAKPTQKWRKKTTINNNKYFNNLKTKNKTENM